MPSIARRTCRSGMMMGVVVLTACSQGLVPEARNVNIPAPVQAETRQQAVNERPDGVIYLPLGHDVLIPEAKESEMLPDREVGPFELRGETLGGALQLILADVDIPIAFQTDLGLTRTVTVTNMKGKLADVVDQICSLANLYCSFERGALVVKDTQSFTVVVPPIGDAEARTTMMTSVSAAIQALTQTAPVVDNANRTIIYQATSRTADQVNRYFQRMRASTSMIVYETYIWEVSLNSSSAAGIQWEQLESDNGFNFGVSLNGSVDPEAGTPVSIGLPTSGSVNFTTGDVLRFISSYGAVKTISQPQLTVLSGSTARLRVADTQNYVSEITRTVSGDQTTVSTETDSVESGFTLQIGSSWDNATVYGNINIQLQEVREIQTFDDNPEAIVQLPQTTEREVTTQVRVRPGDSLLIAGLVREVDNMNKEGIGIEKPIVPTNRSSGTSNVELVFLLKPRVVAFVDSNDRQNRTPVNSDFIQEPVELPHGRAQTSIPVPEQDDEDAVNDDIMASDEVIPTIVEKPTSIEPNEPRPSSVVARLFDSGANAQLASVPPVEKVVNAPLAAEKTVAADQQVVPVTNAQVKTAKATNVTKATPKKNKAKAKKKKKALKPVAAKSAPVAAAKAVPAASATTPNEPAMTEASTEAPMDQTASDVADKVLSAPDSHAPAAIPDDLPSLTDGTVLPPATSSTTNKTVKP